MSKGLDIIALRRLMVLLYVKAPGCLSVWFLRLINRIEEVLPKAVVLSLTLSRLLGRMPVRRVVGRGWM